MPKFFRKTSEYFWLILIAVLLCAVAVLYVFLQKKESGIAGIYITEICPVNKVNAYDDNGDYGADYIELFNSSDQPVSLEGLGLSDSHKNYFKYRFDDVEIGPGETIIVWCSPNLDDVSNYSPDYHPVDYHQTEFSIKAGETIYFSNKNKILQVVTVPKAIPENRVYSCYQQDLKTFYITESSPYEVLENEEEKMEVSLEAPLFSLESGWYSDSFLLTLSAQQGTIYYTTDGTEPDLNSKTYTAPIQITNRSTEDNVYANISGISALDDYLPNYKVDKATVVKAICVKDGKVSPVATRTYFVGLQNKPCYEGLSVMEITVDPDALFDYYDGIYMIGNVFDTYKSKFIKGTMGSYWAYNYANYAKEGKGWERAARIEFFDTRHRYVFSQDIGIRIHGNWSTSFNQKGFNLYVREEYDGNTTFLYNFFGKNYSRLMLRAGGYRDVYATKMRDVLNQALVADRAVGIQQAIPVAVFINGEYWGLYNLQETICENYISENYGVDINNVLFMKNGQANADDANAGLYEELVTYAADHDLSKEKYYRKIEEKIDIQSYIDYMAFEIYVANCDSVANNFARWRTLSKDGSKYGDGKWRFLLYDTDDSAGMETTLSNYKVDSFIEGHWAVDPLGENGDTMFKALMENDDFKCRFVTSFMDMANHNFAYERVHEAIEKMSATYMDGVAESQRRFRREEDSADSEEAAILRNRERFLADVQVIDDFYFNRYSYIVGYMKKDLNLSGELCSVKVSTNAPDHCVLGINTMTGIESGWSGSYYSDYPVTLNCTVDTGYKFVCWKDASGNVISTDPQCELQLTEDTEVTAVIQLRK